MFYLSLNAGTALNVKVKLNGEYEDVTAENANGAVTPKYVGSNTWQITLPDLPANALREAYPFTLSVNGTEVFKLDISGLAYVNLVFQYRTVDTAEAQALAALYENAEAAYNYKQN